MNLRKFTQAKFLSTLVILLCVSYTRLAFSFDPKRCQEFSSDCEYYSCLAAAKHCSHRSYLVNFGHRYCLRYESRLSNFTEDGQVWMQEVRKCLIREMSSYEENLSCKELKVRAFSDHVPCYIESGFCELSKWDKKQILKTVWPTLKNLRVLIGGFEISRACSNRKTGI